MASPARTAAALVAALLVPGLGHLVLGKRRLAAAFFAIVTVTWGVGLALKGHLPEPSIGAPLTLVGAAAGWGAGLLSLAARLLELDRGDLLGPLLEYGTAYLLCAAVMNLLLVLDVWERARGHKQ
jgi:hypothetical protein